MANLEQISRLSLLPIVDLDHVRLPADGLAYNVPNLCKKKFPRSDKCRQHYERLRESQTHGEAIQCPFGLASYPVKTDSGRFALTAFIPYPRIGGRRERAASKQNPRNKISLDGLATSASQLLDAARSLADAESELITQQAFGLHEIRKLNRTVKQNAERLCRAANPDSPDRADSRLVAIWKASELMSTQFDVVELLANETLTQLPISSEAKIYSLFDKCVRIYNNYDDGGYRISMRAPQGFSPRIRVCDKTIPLIPTILIENAVKYSLPNSEITVSFSQAPKNRVVVRVNNMVNPAVIPDNVRIDDAVFEKGRRIAIGKDGSGNGLYLARLVAEQHGGTINVSDSINAGGLGFRNVAFEVTLPMKT